MESLGWDQSGTVHVCWDTCKWRLLLFYNHSSYFYHNHYPVYYLIFFLLLDILSPQQHAMRLRLCLRAASEAQSGVLLSVMITPYDLAHGPKPMSSAVALPLPASQPPLPLALVPAASVIGALVRAIHTRGLTPFTAALQAGVVCPRPGCLALRLASCLAGGGHASYGEHSARGVCACVRVQSEAGR